MTPPQRLSRPRRFQRGDRVVVLSPSSWVDGPSALDDLVQHLCTWGLRLQFSPHAFDRRGYMAGAVADRLDDLNTALRDPRARALVASTGGRGALRLMDGVDEDALRGDPKSLVGYSDITALHQVWRRCRVPAVHGAVHGAHHDLVRAQLLDAASTTVSSDAITLTAALTTGGNARGDLVGGNLEILARCTGVVQPSWQGCLVMLEAIRAAGLGMVDQVLTQLRLSGALDGITDVAVGSFGQCTEDTDCGWTVVDTLRDLGVPIL